MKNLPIYSTEYLKKFITDKFQILKDIYPTIELNILFKEDNANSPEGLYVYSNEEGYHYIYSERGSRTTNEVIDNLFEISYKIFVSVTFSYSFKITPHTNTSNKEYRIKAYTKQLEMLELLGKEYRQRGEIDIKKYINM